jgi:hypothetical protein
MLYQLSYSRAENKSQSRPIEIPSWENVWISIQADRRICREDELLALLVSPDNYWIFTLRSSIDL